jgi:hypothetical protein
VALNACGSHDQQKPCLPGVHRPCKTDAGEAGGELCKAQGTWSGTCEVPATQCDPEECRQYGLCRLATPVFTTAMEGVLFASVAWTGSELGVAWRSGYKGDSRLWFARFTPEGYWNSELELLVKSVWGIDKPRLAYSSGAYAVAWTSYLGQDIYLGSGYLVLDALGEVQDSFEVMQQRPQMYPAASEEGFKIHYREGAPLVESLGRSGERLGDPVELQDGIESVGQFKMHDYVWTGTEHVLLWELNHELQLNRFSADGSRAAAPLVLQELEYDGYASLAYNGSQYAVAWGDTRPIWFARVSATGELVSEPVVISEDSTWDAPVLTWTGEDWVIMWTAVLDPLSVWARRFAPDGSAPYEKLRLATDTGLESIFPAVALADGALSVLWNQSDPNDVSGYNELVTLRVGLCR